MEPYQNYSTPCQSVPILPLEIYCADVVGSTVETLRF